MMDNNDDLTIAARVKGWDIFAPKWDYLRQFSTLPLGSLCAMSVGLHPAFADPTWVFLVAKPYFSGEDYDELCPLEDKEEGAKRAALLEDFLQRVHVAVAELVPRGTLPIADGAANGERTVVRVADFVTWAEGKGWELSPEFSRPAPVPVAATGAKWPWGDHETELLRHLEAAAKRFWKNYDPTDKTTAPTNERVIKWLEERGVARRNAEVMATILRVDGLPTGPRK